MTTFLRTILFYIMAFFISTAPTPSVVEGVTGQPHSFFPGQSETQTDKAVSHLIYRGLLKYDASGDLVPDLAEKWEVSEDGLAYTVTIKKGQTWSHGIEITSDDLIYTAFNLPTFSGVATDKIDDYTVRYTLPNKFAPFPSLLTEGIMPVNALEKQNPLMPISNGEFQVVSIKREGPAVKKIVLQNKGASSHFKKLIFRYYSNEDELLTAARLGEVDTFSLSYETGLELYNLKRVPLEGVYYSILFNLRNEVFEEDSFRQKLARVTPVRDLTEDLGIAVEGPISSSPYTNLDVDYDLYDPDFIPEFTDESLTLIVSDIRHQRLLAEEIARIWEEKLGVTVTVLPMDPAGIKESIVPSRNFEVLLYGQQVGRDPDRYINWHSTQADFPGLNITGFEQIRADRALEEGRNILDSDERRVHYDDFQANVMEHVPAIFLHHPYMNYYVSNSLKISSMERVYNAWDRFENFSSWERRFLN